MLFIKQYINNVNLEFLYRQQNICRTNLSVNTLTNHQIQAKILTTASYGNDSTLKFLWDERLHSLKLGTSVLNQELLHSLFTWRAWDPYHMNIHGPEHILLGPSLEIHHKKLNLAWEVPFGCWGRILQGSLEFSEAQISGPSTALLNTCPLHIMILVITTPNKCWALSRHSVRFVKV